jgi:hypothetical protein
MKNINSYQTEKFTNKLLLIIGIFFLILVISPFYLFTTDQLYHPILDYSSFVPDTKLAGWDTKLLIYETHESPFTPLLIFVIDTYKLTTDNQMRLFQILYKIITFSTIYIIYNSLKNSRGNMYLLLLVLISIVSYQFIHELERGQWNLIAMYFLFIALKNKNNGNLFSSVLLYTAAIQIKVFPIFFILLFLIRGNFFYNFKFFSTLIIINITLLFCNGYEGMLHFIEITSVNSRINPGAWEMNPAMRSTLKMIENLSGYNLEIVYYVLPFLIISTIIYKYMVNENILFIESYAFLALTTLVILLIPKSYDYRVSIIIVPIIYYFENVNFEMLIENNFNKFLLNLILINFHF